MRRSSRHADADRPDAGRHLVDGRARARPRRCGRGSRRSRRWSSRRRPTDAEIAGVCRARALEVRRGRRRDDRRPPRPGQVELVEAVAAAGGPTVAVAAPDALGRGELPGRGRGCLHLLDPADFARRVGCRAGRGDPVRRAAPGGLGASRRPAARDPPRRDRRAAGGRRPVPRDAGGADRVASPRPLRERRPRRARRHRRPRDVRPRRAVRPVRPRDPPWADRLGSRRPRSCRCTASTPDLAAHAGDRDQPVGRLARHRRGPRARPGARAHRPWRSPTSRIRRWRVPRIGRSTARAGPERAIAATKTYTAELLAIAALSAALGRRAADRAALRRCPDAIGASSRSSPRSSGSPRRRRGPTARW